MAGWQADNDLQVRAAQVMTADGSTIIRVRNDVNSPWRELMQWGPDETFGGVFGFTPDNTQALGRDQPRRRMRRVSWKSILQPVRRGHRR